MKRSAKTLLRFAEREPYGKMTELIDAPVVFYEILTLAEQAEKGNTKAAGQIKALIGDVIEVVIGDPEGLAKLENLAQNGYRLAFLPPQKLVSG